MPWDATWLWVADVDPEGRLGEPRHVTGGPDESVFQPEWSPDGVLHFVSDHSGWWNLYAYTGESTQPVVLGETEMGVAQWELGYATYKFLNRHRIALVLQDGPGQTLAVWHMEQRNLQPLRLPYTSIKPYLATDGEQIAVVAAAPDRTPGVALIDSVGGGVRELAEGPGQPEEVVEPHQPQLQARGGLDVPREQRVEVARLALKRFERRPRARQRLEQLTPGGHPLHASEEERGQFGQPAPHLPRREALVAQRLGENLEVGHPRHDQLVQTPRRPEDAHHRRRHVLLERAVPPRVQ